METHYAGKMEIVLDIVDGGRELGVVSSGLVAT
jgi:hypothetical protein